MKSSAAQAKSEHSVAARDLERWYKKFHASESAARDFIACDPVQFPRGFTRRADVEIAAFLAAAIAWGRRDLIIRSARRIFSLMSPSPFDFVMAGQYRELSGGNQRGASLHRTFFEDDLNYFCAGFRHCYAKYKTLEKLFVSAPDIWSGISLFREEMAAANGGRYSKHIANPAAGSACKRINLALRWLVREGPVDLHLWKKIPAAALYIPLDVHVARTARKLGLLKRKSNDRKAVVELTENLKQFCPSDPVKYDFALFSM